MESRNIEWEWGQKRPELPSNFHTPLMCRFRNLARSRTSSYNLSAYTDWNQGKIQRETQKR